MKSTSTVISQLQSEFNERVELREAQAGDACDGLTPQAVAAPRDDQSVRDLVSWCGRENVAFVARGGGSKWHIGATPQRFDLLISTEHLNQIIEHDEGNATVQAGAGITLEKLDAAMRERGQFVPLDRSRTSATLGGVVATNRFDGDKMKYGAPRDLVVGLHAVLSDGRWVKAGSKVVKNVSGYDLNKIFIGSFGTLGLITQVTVRLRPQSEEQRAWQSTLGDWNETVTLAQEIANGAFEPTRLQLSSTTDGFIIHAQFEGGAAAVEAQLARLPASEDTRQESGDTSQAEGVEVRAVLPLSLAPEWAHRAREQGALKVLWQVGTGVVEASFDEAIGVEGIAGLRWTAEKLDGFLVVERVPLEWKTPDLVWGAPRADFALMKRLKCTLDAANVCAPGRFIGGL